MVFMAAVENDHHRSARASLPPSDSLAPVPPPSRMRLHGFSFPSLSWGTHRLLRCSKSPASTAPPACPEAPSLDKEKANRSAGATGGGSLQRQRGPQRPWNLRTRPSATAAPPRPERSDDAAEAAMERAPVPTKDTKKRGFSIVLSKEEIAEDFAAIRGTRPPRRPKKRPRAVQRQLDLLYPGLCLSDVTPGSYKIEER
ncbi:uncharacterized protein LOC133918334 [Phragmites australis]|uniref:uncharacterized protein LOC133918334 n=1 Tax=Phragmites australis TaxID=29695 RepID=UPI002D78029D|nr:uncharacterized protein LOC133918334 [Phragmites australis]